MPIPAAVLSSVSGASSWLFETGGQESEHTVVRAYSTPTMWKKPLRLWRENSGAGRPRIENSSPGLCDNPVPKLWLSLCRQRLATYLRRSEYSASARYTGLRGHARRQNPGRGPTTLSKCSFPGGLSARGRGNDLWHSVDRLRR